VLVIVAVLVVDVRLPAVLLLLGIVARADASRQVRTIVIIFKQPG
jgi:hypothetical protein